MYVPPSVVQQLERLKEMDSKRNVWDIFQEHARVGLELETNFGWLFKKKRL
jgi:hypothetical protein